MQDKLTKSVRNAYFCSISTHVKTNAYELNFLVLQQDVKKKILCDAKS